MLLPVDDINKFTFALARGLQLQWKEMVAKSDHRLFYPKVFGLIRDWKVVVRGFRSPEPDPDSEVENWEYATRFRMQIVNPTGLFFQIERAEDFLEMEANERFNVKTNQKARFFKAFDGELQADFLTLWDNHETSHFSLKADVMEMNLAWVIYREEELKTAVKVLELMCKLAARIERGKIPG